MSDHHGTKIIRACAKMGYNQYIKRDKKRTVFLEINRIFGLSQLECYIFATVFGANCVSD